MSIEHVRNTYYGREREYEMELPVPSYSGREDREGRSRSFSNVDNRPLAYGHDRNMINNGFHSEVYYNQSEHSGSPASAKSHYQDGYSAPPPNYQREQHQRHESSYHTVSSVYDGTYSTPFGSHRAPEKPSRQQPVRSQPNAPSHHGIEEMRKEGQKLPPSRQMEEYKKKAFELKKELQTLKEQRYELRGDGTRSPSPDTKRFLKENTKLQLEIQNKLKSINNMLDMMNGMVGEHRSSAESQEPPSPERKPKQKWSQKYNYIFYDPEMHWCRVCNIFPQTAKDYLNHLHSPDHETAAVDHVEAPWHSIPANEGYPSLPTAPAKRTPIRGLQFFVPATAWYCKLCDQFIGDLHCASAHIKSIMHSKNYNKFVQQNPHWETDWVSDRQKAFEKLQTLDKHSVIQETDTCSLKYVSQTVTISKDVHSKRPPKTSTLELHRTQHKGKCDRSNSQSSLENMSDVEIIEEKSHNYKRIKATETGDIVDGTQRTSDGRLTDDERKILEALRYRIKIKDVRSRSSSKDRERIKEMQQRIRDSDNRSNESRDRSLDRHDRARRTNSRVSSKPRSRSRGSIREHRDESNERRGGSNERRGGSNERRGGSNERRGESNERSGGSKERSGGSNERSGGSNARSGGSNERRSGSNVCSIGSQEHRKNSSDSRDRRNMSRDRIYNSLDKKYTREKRGSSQTRNSSRDLRASSRDRHGNRRVIGASSRDKETNIDRRNSRERRERSREKRGRSRERRGRSRERRGRSWERRSSSSSREKREQSQDKRCNSREKRSRSRDRNKSSRDQKAISHDRQNDDQPTQTREESSSALSSLPIPLPTAFRSLPQPTAAMPKTVPKTTMPNPITLLTSVAVTRSDMPQSNTLDPNSAALHLAALPSVTVPSSVIMPPTSSLPHPGLMPECPEEFTKALEMIFPTDPAKCAELLNTMQHQQASLLGLPGLPPGLQAMQPNGPGILPGLQEVPPGIPGGPPGFPGLPPNLLGDPTLPGMPHNLQMQFPLGMMPGMFPFNFGVTKPGLSIYSGTARKAVRGRNRPNPQLRPKKQGEKNSANEKNKSDANDLMMLGIDESDVGAGI